MRMRASDVEYSGSMWPTVFWATCAIGLLIPGLMLFGSIAPTLTLFCLTYCFFLFMARMFLGGEAGHLVAFIFSIGTFILVPTVQRSIVSQALEPYRIEAIKPSGPVGWSGHVRVESEFRRLNDSTLGGSVKELLLSGDIHTVTLADVNWSEFSDLTSRNAHAAEEEISFGWSNAGDCPQRLEEHWNDSDPPPREIVGARHRVYRERVQRLTSDCIVQTRTAEGFDWRLRYGTWDEADEVRETRVAFGRSWGESYGDGLKVDFITLQSRDGGYALRLFHPMQSAWKVPFELGSTHSYRRLLDISGLRVMRSHYPEEQYWRDEIGHWLGEEVARDMGYGSAIPFGFH